MFANDFAPPPAIVRLLYVIAFEAHTCAPAPPHTTVPVPAVNVPVDPLASPPNFIVLEPPFNVPLDLVHPPVNV